MTKRVLVRLLVAPALALVIGGALILAGDAIIKTPIQLYNGVCSKQYSENYRAMIGRFETQLDRVDGSLALTRKECDTTHGSIVSTVMIVAIHLYRTGIGGKNG